MAPPLVLHVLPLDLSRGAQTYAREVRLALDGDDLRHRTVTLFASAGGALRPDLALGVQPGLLRRAGLDPRAVIGLRRMVRDEAPDIVVAHGSEPLKYAVLAGVPHRKLLAYKIGAGHTRLTGGRRRVNRALLARAGFVAAVSQAAAAEARDLGVPAERLRVIPNGRDPAAFAPRARSGTDATATARLVWIGHLDAAKRPERFVEIVRALRSRGVEVAAALAGDGPRFETVLAGAREVGIDVLGNVADIGALLAASDVLVLTSDPNEGMPGVLIEAGMAGLPAVTTDVPGSTDVVVDGVTGFVVPVDDLEPQVRAVRTLVEDRALRERLGAAARERCERDFSLEASFRGWRALLAEMLDR